MNARSHDHDAACRLYGRPVDEDAMRRHLPDLGQSLHIAAVELSCDITLDRCDEMLARLAGAVEAVRHLRRELASGVCRHGTG
jgi:hypothetical protein